MELDHGRRISVRTAYPATAFVLLIQARIVIIKMLFELPTRLTSTICLYTGKFTPPSFSHLLGTALMNVSVAKDSYVTFSRQSAMYNMFL